jgi:hypothetical protein
MLILKVKKLSLYSPLEFLFGKEYGIKCLECVCSKKNILGIQYGKVEKYVKNLCK